jgi:hypothetical protein
MACSAMRWKLSRPIFTAPRLLGIPSPRMNLILRKNRHFTKVWYSTEILKGELDAIERALIRELKPAFNRVKYRGTANLAWT